jgi:hypothetical protein
VARNDGHLNKVSATFQHTGCLSCNGSKKLFKYSLSIIVRVAACADARGGEFKYTYTRARKTTYLSFVLAEHTSQQCSKVHKINIHMSALKQMRCQFVLNPAARIGLGRNIVCFPFVLILLRSLLVVLLSVSLCRSHHALMVVQILYLS